MKRALIPLFLIAMMVLAVTVATAENFHSPPNGITSDNQWTTNDGWQYGFLTETHATASHALQTGADGAFDYSVLFMIGDTDNTVKIGLTDSSSNVHMIEYRGGHIYLNGADKGAFSGVITDDHWAKISSSDGINWHFEVPGIASSDVPVSAVPTTATLDITQGNSDPATLSPIIRQVDFLSGAAANPTPDPTGTPTPDPTGTPTPNPTGDPTPAPVVTVPVIDLEQVQDFYNNAYKEMGSPYDTVTYNADGTYTIVKGYPTADNTKAAVPASYAVSGTVTAAADGKPISGARILFGDTVRKTDDFGKFRFDGVSKGSTDIAVSADGFASQSKTVDVNDNLQLSFELNPASAGSSTVASAANETGNTTAAMNNTMNTTAPVTMPANNTTNPVPTQTKSPGFEAIVAALSLIAVAGLLVYVNRKK